MDSAEKLTQLLRMGLAMPEFQNEVDDKGEIVKTHCNQFVTWVLNNYGYYAMDGLLANDICDYVSAAPEWLEMDANFIQKAANRGLPGIAAHKYAQHGHVAMIAPGKLVISGHWDVECPMVASIGGKQNGFMGANFAFPVVESPPKYYLLNAK